MSAVSVDPSVTTGPIAGSTKIHRKFAHVPGGRVPFRRVACPTASTSICTTPPGRTPIPTR